MNRTAPSRVGIQAFFVVLGLCPFPGMAHANRYTAVNANLGVMPIALPTLNVHNPALPGGVNSFQAPLLPAIQLGAGVQLPQAIPGMTSMPALQPQEAAAVQNQLTELVKQIAPQGAQQPTASEIQAASNEAFDGSLNKEMSSLGSDAAMGGGSNNGGSNNNGGNGGDNSNGGGSNNSGSLGRLYPRVVMILDPLESAATDKVVEQIEALADRGVRVIFVTPRPEKGENSAESVLVSRLKVRTTKFPVIVVSYNGARIAVRNSRAENPKPIVDDEPGFSDNTLETFRKIAGQVKSKLKGRGEMPEFSTGGEQGAYIYGADLPKGVDAAAFESEYNKSLRQAGLKYKVEVGQRPDGTRFYYTQSTALRLNTGRIFNALHAQYPELKETLTPSEVLVLADSRKTNKFLKSLPGKGYYIHGVTNGASLEQALSAVLGREDLKKVSIIRSKLRGYADWLEARRKWGPASKGARGGGGPIGKKGSRNGKAYRDLGFYRGIIMYDLMGRLYHMMRKGQYMDASPEAASKLLRDMWYYPENNGVRLNQELAVARRTPQWKALQKGIHETAQVWLRNYYKRNFKNYPDDVSERVVSTMINLARDSKNSVTVEYASPYTGRRYMVHVLPARASLERDDKGNMLVADVYRTGAEPYQEEFDESVEVSLLSHAMLQGYAEQRADNKWYVNDEANPRVKIRFHYFTRDLTIIQTPEEIMAKSAEITAMIEKMEADKEFLDHWDEQEAKNNKLVAERKKLKPGKKR